MSAITPREWNRYSLKEVTIHHAQARVIARAESWGWLPALTFTSACGLLLFAFANSTARFGSEWATALLYAGLLTLFVPVAARLLSAAPSRQERIGIIVVLAGILYLVKVLRSPVMFTGFDELLHFRTAQDILRTGHLLHGNSLLPISPLYPGLEIITTAVMRLTGLPIFEAGILMLGVARVLFGLALFLFFEEISNSARVGGVAALLYMTNLSFVFFDAQFAYESLALPLGVFGLFIIARRLRRCETHRGATLAMALTIAAVIVTHHLTSFAVVGFLVLIFLVGFLTKQSVAQRMDLGRIVLFSVAAVLAWLFLIAPTVVYYLSPYTVGAVQQMIGLIFNEAITRPLFTDYAGQGTPIWERVVSLTSVVLSLLGLPWGLIALWRRYHGYLILPHLSLRGVPLNFAGRRIGRSPRNLVQSDVAPLRRGRPKVSQRLLRALRALAMTPRDARATESYTGESVIPLALGVASLAYGATLPLRLMPSAAEVSSRSAEFLFLAIAFVLALGPAQRWLSGIVSWKRSAGMTMLATILFIGGFILGAGPAWARLPGPYLVSADLRTIEPESIAAAKWALAYLGPGNRFAADRVNGLLMVSYGLQRPLTDVGDQLDVSPMYFSSEFGEQAQAILDKGHIRYVIVDYRLSTGLPRVGVYFQSVEPSAYLHKTPIPKQALTKFDQLPNMSRVFDSGDVVIFEVHETGRPYVEP